MKKTLTCGVFIVTIGLGLARAQLPTGGQTPTDRPFNDIIYRWEPDRPIRVFLEKDGTRTILADKCEGKGFNGPNDVVVKSNGALYFTDSISGMRGANASPLRELAVQAQQRGSAPSPKIMTLTGQDYAEIENLSNRYVWAIDACTNAGYDFADLFTDDGEFGLGEQFGVPATRAKTKGREALANVAGGDGKGGCRDPKTMLGYGISHFVVNHVVTPTAEGAVGKSYVMAIGVGGDPTKIERQGGYEDVYVKTPAGWRFKSRVHVFPNMAESVQFGRGGRRGQAAPAPTSPNQPQPAR